MSDDVVLGLLRAIRGDVADLRGDMVEVKERLGLLRGQCASLSRLMNRLLGDVEQIKRRLDLVDAT